jgi:hypothetical protein
MRTLEDDLRAARLRADERTQEASNARELLVREQGTYVYTYMCIYIYVYM